MNERMFPIQKASPIPWSVAERAYEAYAARYGTGQSLERLAERGGFGIGEMDALHPTWRDDARGITALRDEVVSLRAALAAERKRRVDSTRAWCGAHQRARLRTRERDAAIARAEAAERERDLLQTIRETNLDHIAELFAVGQRLMCERDQARATLRAAANRARGIAQSADDDEAALAVLGPMVAERDEARAACAEMRLVVESLREAIADRASPRMATLRHSEWWGPDQWATIHAPSDAGAPLLAELRALRAVRDAAEAFLSPPTLHAIGDARERLRAALDAAKAGG